MTQSASHTVAPLPHHSILPLSPPSSSVSPLDRRQDGHCKSGTEIFFFNFCIHILRLTGPCRAFVRVCPRGSNGRHRVYLRRSMEGLCGSGRTTDRLTRCVCGRSYRVCRSVRPALKSTENYLKAMMTNKLMHS